jgi:ketosteroid isomerase-like protein
MQKIIVALIAGGLVTVAACQRGAAPAPAAETAPAPAAASTQPPPEQVAVQLINDWINAIPKRDTARIGEVLADDFIAILPDGRKVTKAEHLQSITDGSYKPVSFTLDQTSARAFGDTVVVTYYQMEENAADGKNTREMSAWTDILAKRNGQWQVVAEHGSNY